jgi:hypothetical protein
VAAAKKIAAKAARFLTVRQNMPLIRSFRATPAVTLHAHRVASAWGCGENRDPGRQSLDRLVSAAKARNAGEFVASLAPDFQAADGSGRADAEAMLRRYFAAYERLDVRISDVSVERAADAARVRFRADLSGKPRSIGGLDGLLPARSAYRFDLRLSPGEGGRWLVTWAMWENASN